MHEYSCGSLPDTGNLSVVSTYLLIVMKVPCHWSLAVHSTGVHRCTLGTCTACLGLCQSYEEGEDKLSSVPRSHIVNYRPEFDRKTWKRVTTAAGVGRDSFVTGVGLTRLGRQAGCDGWNEEHFRMGVEVTPVVSRAGRLAERGERLMTPDQRPFALNGPI